MARRTLEEKNPGTCVARLASTFFVYFVYFVYFVVQILLQIGLRAMRASNSVAQSCAQPIDWACLNSDFCRLSWQLLVAMPPR